MENPVAWLDKQVALYGDEFIRGFPFIDSSFFILFATFLYLCIVWIGPKIMASKEPFSLRGLLVVYNFFLTILSLYMSVEYFLAVTSFPNFSWSCLPVDKSGDAFGMRIRKVSWLYYMSKVIEFCDTFFFILRKKQNQISFLHVYHHTNLAIFGWAGVAFLPTGETYFLAMLNSFIHVIMYFYYGVSAMGPQWQKFLWWKRYLTQLQLFQFVSIMGHYSYVYLFSHSCDFPRSVLIAYILNTVGFFVLFMHFYRLAYIAKAKEAEKQRKIISNGVSDQKSYGDLSSTSPRKID